MAEWIAHDRQQPKDERKLPPDDEPVWIFDAYYHGVTIGRWVGWWEDATGSDDIGVLAWRPMERPEPPPEEMTRHDD